MSDIIEIFETAADKAKRIKYDELLVMKICMLAVGFLFGAAFAAVFKKRAVACAMAVVALVTLIVLLNKYYGDTIADRCRKCYKSAKSASFFKR